MAPQNLKKMTRSSESKNEVDSSPYQDQTLNAIAELFFNLTPSPPMFEKYFRLGINFLEIFTKP